MCMYVACDNELWVMIKQWQLKNEVEWGNNGIIYQSLHIDLLTYVIINPFNLMWLVDG
jgi:hypothetical protein